MEISVFNENFVILFHKMKIVSTFETFCPLRFALNLEKNIAHNVLNTLPKFPGATESLGVEKGPGQTQQIGRIRVNVLGARTAFMALHLEGSFFHSTSMVFGLDEAETMRLYSTSDVFRYQIRF